MKSGTVLVEVVRSGFVENVHTGHVVTIAADGSVRERRGDPSQPFFPRSCAKPLQAVGMRRLGLDGPPPWLALAAASHSGGPAHLAVVGDMLAAAGLGEDDLRCPADWPLGQLERQAAIAAGSAPRRLTMNCSGKHAAMLSTCLVQGWPTEGYLDPAHPLQTSLALTVEELTGDEVAAVGVDGCGAPVFAVTLPGLARAFARIAGAPAGPERDIADAMRAHPDLVGGPGRPATRLMSGVAGLVAKDGADGGYAAALPDGRSVALKIDDGAQRAADRTVAAALRSLGITSPVLDELLVEPVLGGGVPVGRIRAVGW